MASISLKEVLTDIFTSNERSIIIFTVTLVLLGNGIYYLCKKMPAAEITRWIQSDFTRTNINEADQGSLQEIPGIGKVLARRIVEYRKRKGTIKALQELRDIQGITEYRFEQLKEHLMVE